jgi:hypothetical protein
MDEVLSGFRAYCIFSGSPSTGDDVVFDILVQARRDGRTEGQIIG